MYLFRESATSSTKELYEPGMMSFLKSRGRNGRNSESNTNCNNNTSFLNGGTRVECLQCNAVGRESNMLLEFSVATAGLFHQ